MDFFSIKSALQERIENATAENLVSENPTEFQNICDHVNAEYDGPKDALKTIKKRLKHKNVKVNMMALELLDTLVKNCGERFHVQMVGKDFLGDYVKIAKAQGLNKDVREKMLDLIQLWSVGFASNDALSPALQVHTQLLNEGFEFPPRTLDTFVHYSSTPKASAGLTSLNSRMAAQNQFVPRGAPGVVLQPGDPNAPQFPRGQVAYPGHVLSAPNPQTHFQGQVQGQGQAPLTTEKIKENMQSMQATLELFAETLAFVNAEIEDVSKHEFIQECYDRCKRWQQHLKSYVENCTDDSLFEPLLQLNDSFNSRFEYYDDCVSRYRRANGGSAPVPQGSQVPPAQPQFEASLISFDDPNPLPPAASSSSSAWSQPQPQPQPQPQLQPQPHSYPYANPTSSSPIPENQMEGEARLQIKDILGVDPDEFSEDQVNSDLASLGFTREQIMNMKIEDHEDPEQDEFEKLIDQRLGKGNTSSD